MIFLLSLTNTEQSCLHNNDNDHDENDNDENIDEWEKVSPESVPVAPVLAEACPPS